MQWMLWVSRLVQDGFHREAPGTPRGTSTTDIDALDDIEDAVWDEAVDALALVRAAYAGAQPSYGPEVFDIWRISQLASSLPWYFTVRGSVDPSIQVPAYATALARIVRRTSVRAHRQICSTLQKGEESQKLSLGSLVRLAGPSQLAVAIAASSPTGASPVVAGRWHNLAAALVAGQPRGIGDVPALAAQLDAILLFGAAYTGLERVMWNYHLARRFLYHDLVAVLGETSELKALLAQPCEPEDCFIVEPPAPATVGPAARATWFSKLAELAVPLALDSSDTVIRDVLRRMATVMGEPPAGDRVAHTVATSEKLDTLFAEALAFVEYGLRRACLAPAQSDPFDAAARDRVVRFPRSYFASLRPR